MGYKFAQGILHKKIKDRIEFFYNHASVLPSNRYYVGLWGQYMQEAVLKMEDDIFSNNSGVSSNNLKILDRQLKDFKENYVVNEGSELDLQWTVSGITVPTVQAEIIEKTTLDTTKNINYPLIKNHGGVGEITLEITEDRQMGLYQYFNALTNTFFNRRTMTPRSSFQKLGLYIVVINGDFTNPSIIDNKHPHEVPLQIFQFPSIVFEGLKNVKFLQHENAEILKYTAIFKAPYIFQRSYQNFANFEGLEDLTTDSVNILTDDDTDVQGLGHYATSNFEIPASALKDVGNTLEVPVVSPLIAEEKRKNIKL
jgi:hypothetical protein